MAESGSELQEISTLTRGISEWYILLHALLHPFWAIGGVRRDRSEWRGRCQHFTTIPKLARAYDFGNRCEWQLVAGAVVYFDHRTAIRRKNDSIKNAPLFHYCNLPNIRRKNRSGRTYKKNVNLDSSRTALLDHINHILNTEVNTKSLRTRSVVNQW